MAITSIISIYYIVFVDPIAVRYSLVDLYWGTADFQFVYGAACLMGPLFVYSFLEKMGGIKLKLSFCVIAVLIALCNLGTAVVISIISIILAIMVKYRKKTKGYLALMIGMFVFFTRKLWGGLLMMLVNKSKHIFWHTQKKIIAVLNIIMGIEANIDTLGSRLEKISYSLNTFKKNPIFGVSFKEYGMDTIGNHCQWIDDLARMGVLGNILMWANYFWTSYYYIKRNKKNKFIYDSLISSWITFFVLGFLNPCFSAQILAVLFIVILCFPTKQTVTKKESILLKRQQYNKIQEV